MAKIKKTKTSNYKDDYDWDLPENIINLFQDIGAGICNMQKLSDAEKFTYDMSKVKEYKPKTKIPEIISQVLLKSNSKDDYNWKYDKKFVSNGTNIEIITYSIKTCDWCMVSINGKIKKISKKYLRELYEENFI